MPSLHYRVTSLVGPGRDLAGAVICALGVLAAAATSRLRPPDAERTTRLTAAGPTPGPVDDLGGPDGPKTSWLLDPDGYRHELVEWAPSGPVVE
ncbi:hypothetical protein [Kribbella sancticallisti]|uniref:VOC family protein n=1 Tax=Kribbella sancticallisti TaxID=460087 RepID=UPI0031CE3607